MCFAPGSVYQKMVHFKTLSFLGRASQLSKWLVTIVLLVTMIETVTSPQLQVQVSNKSDRTIAFATVFVAIPENHLESWYVLDCVRSYLL